MAVLKDGRIVGHVHVAIFLQNIAGSFVARLLPPAVIVAAASIRSYTVSNEGGSIHPGFPECESP